MKLPHDIAAVAVAALRDPAFEGHPLLCSRFARQVSERAAARPLRHLFGLSARATLRAFRGAGLTFVPTAATEFQPGDLIFKWGGMFGHVGIVIDKKHIAHNTTGRGIRIQGNKTISTFEQFGKVDEVARFKNGVI